MANAIHFKTKSGQIPSDSVRIQGPSKRSSSGHLNPVSSVKERNRKGGKCKISWVLQSPVSSPQASPKVEASNRLKQAQHFSRCRKVQIGNSRVHQDLPDSKGMGIIDRPIGCLPSHKCSRVEGGLSGSSKLQGPVSEPNSVGCNGQLNSGSLHKQTRRNSLSRNVRSPVENQDMVPSLSDNIESQTHSRVSECDGRPVQVKPSAVNRMVTTSAGVPSDLSKVVHSPCRSICHSSEPQASTVCVSSPRPKCLGHRCSMGLTAYAYPLMALLHRVIKKSRPCHCLIIVIAPGWPGIPWFWDLVQLSTEIPLQLPVSTTLLKQSHKSVFHCNPQHLNLHTWCLGVDSSKNKTSLWRWQRELLPLRDHQQGPSTSQSGPYLRNDAEKTRWISPLPL